MILVPVHAFANVGEAGAATAAATSKVTDATPVPASTAWAAKVGVAVFTARPAVGYDIVTVGGPRSTTNDDVAVVAVLPALSVTTARAMYWPLPSASDTTV